MEEGKNLCQKNIQDFLAAKFGFVRANQHTDRSVHSLL